MKTNHIKELIAVSFSLLFFGLLQTAVRAQDAIWTNAVSGLWTDAGSWSPNTAPSNNPNVWITNVGSKTVTIDVAVPVGNLTVTNLNVGSVGGATNTLLLSNSIPLNVLGSLTVGASTSGGRGAFVVDGGIINIGGTNVNSLIVGDLLGSTGTVLMTGGQLATTNSSAGSVTYVGRLGVGFMTVSGGMWLAKQVNVGGGNDARAAGILNIAGGTNLFKGGASGYSLAVGTLGLATTGTVLMTDGLLVTTNSTRNAITDVGYRSAGFMTVSGGTWLANQVIVGDGGTKGTLTLAGGINVFSSSLTAGLSATATGVVNVTAGLLVVTNSGGTGQLLVGKSGGGTFTLSGGAVIADQLWVTNGASSSFSASGGSLTVKAATMGSSFSLTNTTATFSSNLTVTGDGALSGTNGVFALYGNFINQSTNRVQFDLSRSTLFFTNAASHTLNLTNSTALDLGGGSSVVQFATNFAIGTLSIALNNQLTLTGVKSGGTTNALYVGWLDLTAWNTNAAGLSTTLSNALTLNDINLYYDPNDTRNAYLQDAQFNLWGGGLLIPIPEPSTAGLILGGALFSAWLLRRKGGRR